MTLENSKRLYEHFISIGRTDDAKELLNKHPNLKEKKVKEEEKVKK